MEHQELPESLDHKDRLDLMSQVEQADQQELQV
jgi:hypothetical protein